MYSVSGGLTYLIICYFLATEAFSTPTTNDGDSDQTDVAYDGSNGFGTSNPVSSDEQSTESSNSEAGRSGGRQNPENLPERMFSAVSSGNSQTTIINEQADEDADKKLEACCALKILDLHETGGNSVSRRRRNWFESLEADNYTCCHDSIMSLILMV
jgi:hypothetical protein